MLRKKRITDFEAGKEIHKKHDKRLFTVQAGLFGNPRPPGATVAYIRWPSSFISGPQAPHYTALPIRPHSLLHARFVKPVDVAVGQTSLTCKKCSCCTIGPFGSIDRGGKDCCDCRKCYGQPPGNGYPPPTVAPPPPVPIYPTTLPHPPGPPG
ncbi:unnamed protein product, partial [Strongylus vulgaris]